MVARAGPRESADPARPELHADPRPDVLGRLRHRVLPGALAAAAHDQQVAVPDLIPPRRTAAPRPQAERPRRAQRQDGHHGVLARAPPVPVAVPGHAVPAVPVQAQPCGPERLAQLRPVVRVQHPERGGQQRVRQRLALAVEAEQPGNIHHPVVHVPPLRPPRHRLGQGAEHRPRAPPPPRPPGSGKRAAPTTPAARATASRPRPAATPELERSCGQSTPNPNARSSNTRGLPPPPRPSRPGPRAARSPRRSRRNSAASAPRAPPRTAAAPRSTPRPRPATARSGAPRRSARTCPATPAAPEPAPEPGPAGPRPPAARRPTVPQDPPRPGVAPAPRPPRRMPPATPGTAVARRPDRPPGTRFPPCTPARTGPPPARRRNALPPFSGPPSAHRGRCRGTAAAAAGR